MKRFLLASLLIACITFSLNAQESSTTKLYLEINEVIPDGDLSTIGLSIRVQVTDEAQASTLRDELVQRFFQGVAHAAQLHIHRTDGPCEVRPL
jgi:hypothetical protein